MADLLGTGISGLLASRVALDTTGHNISNASTPGYSRQNVEFAARAPQPAGGYFIGQGVDVVGVQRSYSQYLTTAVWNQDSSLQRATMFSQLTDDLNNLLGGSTNLQTALDSFYSSVQDAANTPDSAPTRQAMLGQAASLVGTFHSLDQQLGQTVSQVNQRISDSVSSINSLAQSIASLNQQIESESAGGSPPNDLLDRRDQLVQQLSEQVGVTTSAQGNSINVIAGNGQTLVNGATALALKAQPDPYDPTRVNVVASTGAILDGQLQGGSLGGLLDYRGSVLEPAQNQLGRAAVAFASALNAQHRQGMDLNGQLGGDLFTLPAPQALPATGNAGNATLTASIADVGALQASDYTVRFDGSQWSVKTTGGNPVTATGSGTSADPLSFDGLQLVVTGSAAAGDSFKIEPTRAAAGGIQLAVTDPNKLALAAPVKALAADGNQTSVASLSTTDAGDGNLLDTVDIQFSGANTYSINGSGSFTYTPGSPIQYNGWSLSLSGTPASGDQFTIKANTDGAGDNSNALALGKTADLGVLAGGTVSAGSAYASLVADAGTTGAQAQTNLSSQTSLFQQAQQSQQSVAGVNLDEEASNLIKFQQSYQASAQVISTANTIFNTLINAVRG
ncbi:MAG TPA: flagellar hook-associated protein FlgK [Rhodanobacteraceae bacterium]|nr:flagellar hook-associated protein FlgK [Rhodanobacteraceae bacterium]